MKQKTDNNEEQKIKYQIYRKLDRAQALVNEIKELMKKIDLLPINYPDTKTLKQKTKKMMMCIGAVIKPGTYFLTTPDQTTC